MTLTLPLPTSDLLISSNEESAEKNFAHRRGQKRPLLFVFNGKTACLFLRIWDEMAGKMVRFLLIIQLEKCGGEAYNLQIGIRRSATGTVVGRILLRFFFGCERRNRFVFPDFI